MGTVVLAQETIKADNGDPLNQESSWVGGIVPGPGNIAVWDSTITDGSFAPMGSSMTWGGIRIADPAGGIGILSSNTLFLGSGGIDMSAAQNDFSIATPVRIAASQRFVVGNGRNLALSNDIIRENTTAGLQLLLSEGGSMTYTGTSWGEGELLRHNNMAYATLNGTDFAAVGSGGAIVGGATIPGLYTANPTGTGLPNVGGTNVLDYVNGENQGARITGNTFIENHRFNQPNNSPTGWFFDTGATNRVLTATTILVTENVGEQNVRFGGAGVVRIGSTSGGMVIFQNNPQGDLIFDPAGGISQQSAGRALTKLGEGRMIVNTNAGYTGTTQVLEGTLLMNGNASTSSVYVAGGATFGGTGTIAGATTVDGRLAPGNSAGVITFSNALTLQGIAEFEIGGLIRGDEHDGVNVTLFDGLTYGGALLLNFTEEASLGTYNLFDFEGTAGGTFGSVTLGGLYSGALAADNGLWTGSSNGYTFNFWESTGDLNVIPEPSTYAMIFGALALAGAVCWRRRRNG